MLLAESDMSRVQTPEPLAVVVPTLPIRLLVSVIVTLGSDVPDIVRCRSIPCNVICVG